MVKRQTGSLEPLPDADRISSIGTVRAVASEPHLRVDHMTPDDSEDAPPAHRRAGSLGRKRAITNVWNGGALDRKTGERDTTPPIGFRYRIVEKVGAGGMSEIYVEAIIMEMLQKDPAARQISMGQVIFQLRTVMDMYDFPGARIRGSTTGERPAITKKRAPIHRPMVDQCPFPMFQLDSKARIVYANDSFCHFVQLPMQKLRGRSVDETRLALVYPSIKTDALSCAKNQHAEPLQRAFSFELKSGRRSTMLCWLKAQLDKAGKVERVNGYIHPIE